MNNESRPSRDLIGYANQPPAVVWPNEARIAVNFCINYEEGGELCILNGDDRSEVRVSDVAVETRIAGRDLNIESSYEYGSRVGYWRLLKAFSDRGLPATVNLVGGLPAIVTGPLLARYQRLQVRSRRTRLPTGLGIHHLP